ncbi:MAG: AAA-associated domain-containing protein [Sphingobium sp.]
MRDEHVRQVAGCAFSSSTPAPHMLHPPCRMRPGIEIAMVLPRVWTKSLAGLIEEVDELLPMAETLRFMRFAKLACANIVLSSDARRYADADVEKRKALFAQTRFAHMPLAGHIRHISDEHANRSAPARRFREDLKDHMSPDFAARR